MKNNSLIQAISHISKASSILSALCVYNRGLGSDPFISESLTYSILDYLSLAGEAVKESTSSHVQKMPMPISTGDFPLRLKHAMKAAGLTQKELAERAGVSQGFVSKLATGKTTDSRNIYIKLIADALGVSFGWLHYGTGEMYPTNFSADNREV
ncbi:helix-turn-helix domain-containing protein [Morganella morganii]|uniref:helix-turn-helix domain-containing protein n=1 Tax=Morganella morganii TaxID=582 RepID=UPI003EBEC013